MRVMFLGFTLVALLCAQSTSAGELQGAEVLIREALAVWPKKMVAPDERSIRRWSYRDSEKGKLHLEIDAFAEKSGAMAPADARREWLLLLDKALAQTPTEYHFGHTSETDLSYLLQGLPPPETWPDLAKEIRSRPIGEGLKAFRMRGLRLMAAALEADEKAQWVEFNAATDLAAALKYEGNLFNALSNAHGSLCMQSNDPTVRASTFEWDLSHLEMNPILRQSLSVPDLVASHGREKAEQLIARALRLPVAQFYFTHPRSETVKVARALAIKMGAELKQPCWELCSSLDSAPLYEILDKRFPAGADDANDHFGKRDQAHVFYMLSLVAGNDLAKAKEVALKAKKLSIHVSTYDLLEVTRDQGLTVKLLDFLHTLLDENPDAPYWSLYWELAERGVNAEKACRLIIARRGKDSDSDKAKKQLTEILFDSGREAEGLALIRGRIMTADERHERIAVTLQFAALGRELKNKAYVDEALREAVKLAKAGDNRDHRLPTLIDLLLLEGRAQEGEEILALSLQNALREEASSLEPSDSIQNILICLAELYSRSGRHADVLFLLERAPWWKADDLRTIYNETEIGRRSLGAIAASALVHTGRKQEADSLLRFLLERDPGEDELYKLFLTLHEDQALPFFEELQKRHPFEERPLIWKAQILLTAGKLDEAEHVAKQAIAIDPSDGEEGHGDRMRVYAVLGEIVKAKGDDKNAAFFRNVIDAIRLSEEADDLRHAGLTQRAIRTYEKALRLFTDAYCIQSRMALQLASLGKMEEAAARYRKAYELMPYSFGRMESHCFGCEGIFRGKFAQDLAEQVFAELLKKDAQKPQLYYLVGQLRESQNRKADALAAFRKAVELDPDYVNAWKRVIENASTEELRLEAATNLIRLDPSSQSALKQGLKPRAVWPLALLHIKSTPPQPKQCFDLPASKKHRDELRANLKAAKHSEARIDQWLNSSRRNRWSITTPGAALASDRSLAAAESLFGTCMDNLERKEQQKANER